MNKNTLSNPVRSIAFFLTAIILACTFGFTVDGWQAEKEDEKDENIAQNPEQPAEDTEGENKEEDTEQEQLPEEPEVYIPEHTNRITGLEVSTELAGATSLAFVMNAELPAYGISYADMLCEIPTENGGTRLLAFLSRTENLWKIGSITNTRGYISNIAKYFGATVISLGSDDTMPYNKCDTTGMELDLSKSQGYHYTEYMSNVYTNPDLLASGLENAGIEKYTSITSPLSYNHTDFGAEKIVYAEQVASVVRIEHLANSMTELRYDEETASYVVYKNGSEMIDSLNGNTVDFINCFVLFADSITYDNATCNQMVMDTIGSGSGYYITNGTYTEIKWTATSGGIMTFYSLGGDKLTVNRGDNYISFVKSSRVDSVKIQ
ncbi:MAG: DUF3048 C-terminal domain-containing protein [Clostridia bacterium]|nr:DUF3048 C-terminal domain-containing protein [Clostridia bacterium]